MVKNLRTWIVSKTLNLIISMYSRPSLQVFVEFSIRSYFEYGKNMTHRPTLWRKGIEVIKMKLFGGFDTHKPVKIKKSPSIKHIKGLIIDVFFKCIMFKMIKKNQQTNQICRYYKFSASYPSLYRDLRWIIHPFSLIKHRIYEYIYHWHKRIAYYSSCCWQYIDMLRYLQVLQW